MDKVQTITDQSPLPLPLKLSIQMEACSLSLQIWGWEAYMWLPSVVQKVKQNKNYRTGFWFDCIRKWAQTSGKPDLRVPWHVSPTAVLKHTTVSYYLLTLTINCLVNELYLILSHLICILKSSTSVLPKDVCQNEPVEKTGTPQYRMYYETPWNFCPSASALRNHLSFHMYLACGKTGQHSGTHFLISETLEFPGCGQELEDMLTYSLSDSGLSEDRAAPSP